QFSVRRHNAQLFLLLQPATANNIPPDVVPPTHSLQVLCVGLMRTVRSTQGKVGEIGLFRGDGLLVRDVVQQPVDQIIGEVVARFRGTGRVNAVIVVD